jgi:TDG/mug DNA glycosylase family protein
MKKIEIITNEYKYRNGKVLKLKFKTFKPIIKKGLDILFVGINPHPNSIKKGGYFMNNGSFWIQLKEAGITKKRLDSESILGEHIGITNLVLRPTRTSDLITEKELEDGKVRLGEEIDYSKPKVIIFIGKLPYTSFTGKECKYYGWYEDIRGSKAFIMVFPTFRCSKKKKLKVLKLVKGGLK